MIHSDILESKMSKNLALLLESAKLIKDITIHYLDFIHVGKSGFHQMCQVLEKKICPSHRKSFASKSGLGNAITYNSKYQRVKGAASYLKSLRVL